MDDQKFELYCLIPILILLAPHLVRETWEFLDGCVRGLRDTWEYWIVPIFRILLSITILPVLRLLVFALSPLLLAIEMEMITRQVKASISQQASKSIGTIEALDQELPRRQP